MKFRMNLLSAMITAAGMGLAISASAAPFFFTTGNPDRLLGALARSESPGKLETETADDFILAETTVINGATITGLINAPVANITNVEVELYHVFPLDSINPPSGHVLSRVNSPSDVEINTATRDGSAGTLGFVATPVATAVSVGNTVLNGINPSPSRTNGEGPAIGDQVQITITFKQPIVLPPGHYFFRPDVLVSDGDFLYMSAPRPITSPGAPFVGDLQAWIRNSRLAPDWVRIGTDVIGATPPDIPPTFNMTFSLSGDTVPDAGIPGEPNCTGKSVSALAGQFGGIQGGASALGFPSVAALKDSLREFCNP
jgi:hypothetical protein